MLARLFSRQLSSSLSFHKGFLYYSACLTVQTIIMRAEIGNFTFSTIADVGSRTGGSFSLRDAQTDVIVALWGSLS